MRPMRVPLRWTSGIGARKSRGSGSFCAQPHRGRDTGVLAS